MQHLSAEIENDLGISIEFSNFPPSAHNNAPYNFQQHFQQVIRIITTLFTRRLHARFECASIDDVYLGSTDKTGWK